MRREDVWAVVLSETRRAAGVCIRHGTGQVPAHPHEQVINMFEGQFEILITGGESRVLGPGEVFVIPGGAEHSGKAVTRCRILDVFQPVRTEYVWED